MKLNHTLFIFLYFIFTFHISLQAKVVGLYGLFSNDGSESYESSILKIDLIGFSLYIYNKTDTEIYIDKRLSFVYANDFSEPLGDINGSLSNSSSDMQTSFEKAVLLIPPHHSIKVFNYGSKQLIRDSYTMIHTEQTKNTMFKKETLTLEHIIWFHTALKKIVEFNTSKTKIITYDEETKGVWVKEKSEKHALAFKSRFVDSGKPVSPKVGMTRHFNQEQSPIRFKADLVVSTKSDFSDKMKYSVNTYVSDMVVDNIKGLSNQYAPSGYSSCYLILAMY